MLKYQLQAVSYCEIRLCCCCFHMKQKKKKKTKHLISFNFSITLNYLIISLVLFDIFDHFLCKITSIITVLNSKVFR